MTFTDEEYEQMAVIAIKNYLNKDFADDYIKQKFGLAIKRLAQNSKNLDEIKTVGISSISENSTSISFSINLEAGTITDDIKSLLPKPYIRMW